MRGIYFSYINVDDTKLSGVYKKVKGQIKALNSLGTNIKHVYFRSKELFFERERVAVYRNKIHKKLNYWRASIRIAKEYNPDFVLIRYYFPTHIGTLLFLKQLARQGVVVVLEVPTYPYDREIKGNSMKLVDLFVDKIFRNFLKNYVQLVVTPAKGVESIFGVKTVSISNGIDLSCSPKRSKNTLSAEVFNMIAVANVSFWHGYDRVIKGLYGYYKTNPNTKVYFHIVGDGEELENLKKLAKTLGLPEFVIFHGPKHGEELDRLFDKAHVAIGSLGDHRKGLKISASIKTREYCTRGIPFVISCDDVDFPDDFPYMLKVPADESPIDIGQILQFYDGIKDRDVVKEMRDYAEKNLSWEAKLKPVINEINRLLDEKEKASKNRK